MLDLSFVRAADLNPVSILSGSLGGGLEQSLDAPGLRAFDLSPGGSANSRYLKPTEIAHQECREFTKSLCRPSHHIWPRQFVLTLNFPCYIAPKSGVVFLEDGRCLLESVYPSAPVNGNISLERLLGDGLHRDSLGDLMRSAPLCASDRYLAPFCSRWSHVYFHALSESLVQDTVFAARLRPDRLSYVIPETLSAVQRLALAHASFERISVASPLVKVNRAIISSLLYSHALMDNHFLEFANRFTLGSRREGAAEVRANAGAPFIYVARAGDAARRMNDEIELRRQLTSLGFTTFAGDGMDLFAQAAAFRNASLIVGAHGAGLINAAFAKPGAALLELRALNRKGESPMWGMSYKNMCAIKGFAYGVHISPNAVDSDDWSPNIEEIVEFVRNGREQLREQKAGYTGGKLDLTAAPA